MDEQEFNFFSEANINIGYLSKIGNETLIEYEDAHINNKPICVWDNEPIGFTLDEKCFDDAFDALQTNDSYIINMNDFIITFSLPSVISRPSRTAWELIKRVIKNTPLGVPAKINFDSSLQKEIINLKLISIFYEYGNSVYGSISLINNYASYSDSTRNDAYITIGYPFHKAILNG